MKSEFLPSFFKKDAKLILFLAWLTSSCILHNNSFKTRLLNLITHILPKLALVGIIWKMLQRFKFLRKLRMKVVTTQVMYFILILGTCSVLGTIGYELVKQTTHVPQWQKYSGYVMLVAYISSWIKAHNTSPGYITEHNMVRYDNYKYDDVLFVNKICPTLGIRKLARSKYDRFTDRHVARYDHYCGWINNTVGEENYRYFLMFLVMHIVPSLYAAIMCYRLLKGEIIENIVWDAIFYDGDTAKQVEAERLKYFLVVRFLIKNYWPLCLAMIVVTTIVVRLTPFFMFHIYISANGMTTNEYYKWKQIRKHHPQKYIGFEGASKNGTVGENAKKKVKAKTSYSSHATTTTSPDSRSGSVPTNIYDLGCFENFKEIFQPRSLRIDALSRYEASLCKKDKNE